MVLYLFLCCTTLLTPLESCFNDHYRSLFKSTSFLQSLFFNLPCRLVYNGTSTSTSIDPIRNEQKWCSHGARILTA